MNRFIFQNDNRKDLTIETQSFWKSEDLVKILDAQNLIFKRLSQLISLKRIHSFRKKKQICFYAVRVFFAKQVKKISENVCLLLSHGQGLRGELPSKSVLLNNL